MPLRNYSLKERQANGTGVDFIYQTGFPSMQLGFKGNNIYYVRECWCVPCAHRSQKAYNTLQLEFQMVVNYLVDAGNQTQVFCKNKCSSPLSHLSSH